MRREGRKGKYGGGDGPIVPRNALDGDKGVLVYTHEHIWTQGLKDDAAARVMNSLASLLFS